MVSWEQADRISDRIINLLNEEIKAPDMEPLQLLAGILLGLLGYLQTAPQWRPKELVTLERAANAVLNKLMTEKEAI